MPPAASACATTPIRRRSAGAAATRAPTARTTSGLTNIASALEVVGKVTASADEVANRLQNLFEKVTADETVKNFKDLGKEMGRVVDLEEIKKGEARSESALAVVLRLTKELTKGDSFKIKKLFGDMQARAAIEAQLKFEEEYNRICKAVNTGSGGMIDKDLKQASDRLQAGSQKIEATVNRIGGKIGEAFAPGIRLATTEAIAFLTRLLEDETILQRLATRYGGAADLQAAKAIESEMAGESGPGKWLEENARWLSGKKWNEWLDSKIGATSANAARLAQGDRSWIVTRRQELEGTGGAVGSSLLNFGLGGFNTVDPSGRYSIGSHDRALTAGEEAGQKLSEGIVKGISDKAPAVQDKGRKMYLNLKELLSEGILIPIGFQNRFGGEFGGGIDGGGIVRRTTRRAAGEASIPAPAISTAASATLATARSGRLAPSHPTCGATPSAARFFRTLRFRPNAPATLSRTITAPFRQNGLRGGARGRFRLAGRISRSVVATLSAARTRWRPWAMEA